MQKEAPQVAHNSYVHAYGELGLLGGTLFLCSFAYATQTLLALGKQVDAITDPDLRLLGPFLLAMIVAYAFGMLMLSRNYIVPTYMLLGLATAHCRLVAGDAPRLAMEGGPISAINLRLIGRMAMISIAFLIIANVFVKLFVHRG